MKQTCVRPGCDEEACQATGDSPSVTEAGGELFTSCDSPSGEATANASACFPVCAELSGATREWVPSMTLSFQRSCGQTRTQGGRRASARAPPDLPAAPHGLRRPEPTGRPRTPHLPRGAVALQSTYLRAGGSADDTVQGPSRRREHKGGPGREPHDVSPRPAEPQLQPRAALGPLVLRSCVRRTAGRRPPSPSARGPAWKRRHVFLPV